MVRGCRWVCTPPPRRGPAEWVSAAESDNTAEDTMHSVRAADDLVAGLGLDRAAGPWLDRVMVRIDPELGPQAAVCSAHYADLRIMPTSAEKPLVGGDVQTRDVGITGAGRGEVDRDQGEVRPHDDLCPNRARLGPSHTPTCGASARAGCCPRGSPLLEVGIRTPGMPVKRPRLCRHRAASAAPRNDLRGDVGIIQRSA